MRKLRLGIDVGGTFTDFVLLDEEGGTFRVGKCLTTPEDPRIGVLKGTVRLLEESGLSMSDIHYVVHGTTLVANTIIERKGAKTGLITTEGFRDALEIGNEVRYDLYDLFMEKPEPLVPRYRRRGVSERLARDGSVLRSLDPLEVRSVAKEFEGEGIEAVAVCLLHSYRNPAHERAIKDLLEREFPRMQVTLSSEVAPEIREYERTSTTVANAYVRPLMEKYLATLESELRRLGLRGSLYMMLSSGGITTVEVAERVPIQLVESGPAGGATAASFYGRLTQSPDLIAFDMGGTTAKMCIINDGTPNHSNEHEVARVSRFKKGSGLPLKVPVIEMIEIGAGGGSIAYVDRVGLLKVGPQSAEASPGPACYDLGGREPTVSDADLILGYLSADYFLGGEMKLNEEAAREAVKEKIAVPLGIDLVEAALGIHEVVNDNMARATRIHVAEKGRDPRRYTLMAFGGAGPVHAYNTARILGLSRVICPLGAGATSAFGFLVAPMALDFVRSYVVRLDSVNWGHLDNLFFTMEEQARQILKGAGIEAGKITLSRLGEMRYAGQGYEISVPIPVGKLTARNLEEIRQSFYEVYEGLFDRYLTDVPIEALSWRLVASGPDPQISLRFPGIGAKSLKEALKGTRGVYFSENRGFVDCPVYERYALSPGVTMQGPAVVEERESTTIVGPAATACIDDYLNLVMDIV
jgi:N-methylhydantoinase A